MCVDHAGMGSQVMKHCCYRCASKSRAGDHIPAREQNRCHRESCFGQVRGSPGEEAVHTQSGIDGGGVGANALSGARVRVFVTSSVA